MMELLLYPVPRMKSFGVPTTSLTVVNFVAIMNLALGPC